MSDARSIDLARDPRLAAHAESAEPAWLWSTDGTRVLWTNFAGAKVFGAPSPDVLTARIFAQGEPAATQIARIAKELVPEAAPRLERLSWFGVDPMRALSCTCTRIALDDGTPAMLVARTLPQPVSPPPLNVMSEIPGASSPAADIAANNATIADAQPQAPTDSLTVSLQSPSAGGVLRPWESQEPVLSGPTSDARAETDIAPEQRRHPLRFVWQMDADGRFTLTSDEFLDLIGPRAAALLGRPWSEINAELALDPSAGVAQAVATRSTWSGIMVSWPTEEPSARLTVELSGLPVYDRHRTYSGYRGFGVSRDLVNISRLTQTRRASDATEIAAPADVTTAERIEDVSRDVPAERPALAVVSAGRNVLPFRATPANDQRTPAALSPVERKTFSDLAQQLSARLKSADSSAPEALPASPDVAPSARAAGGEEAVTPMWAAEGSEARTLLDRLPIGLLIYRFDALLYANRAFLERAGHPTLEAFKAAGGLETLFIEQGSTDAAAASQSLTIATSKGETTPAEGRLLAIQWNGESALALLLLAPQASGQGPASATAPAADKEIRELKAQLRDAQQRLANAEKRPQDATPHAELLARIGSDMRTPLNTVVGLVDTMLEERFGPIGNERYRAYLSDIGQSGDRIASLIGDLSDLAKVEGGQLAQTFATVSLNDLVLGCVAATQPSASRARVLIRNSLAPELPTISADPALLRQIIQNLLSNSIKLAGSGGQVIVSTAPAAERVVLRMRDTGAGLSDAELAAALQPARSAIAPHESGDTLTLAVTKALAEANNAKFAIITKIGEGTLIEIAFLQRPPGL